MGGVGHAHLVEEEERVGADQVVGVVEGVDPAVLGEDPPVGVLDPAGQLGEGLGAEPGGAGVSERDQAGLEVLGERPVLHRMIGEPAGEVDLDDRRPGPVDHRRGQDAPHAEFLAEPDEEGVHPGGVDVGQLGQVADPHQRRGFRPSSSSLGIAHQAGGEAEADRLEDRVDPVSNPSGFEEIDGRVEAVEGADHVGDRHDLHAPVGRGGPVGRVDAQDEVGTRFDGEGHLDRVEAVDGRPVSTNDERGDVSAHILPGASGVASHVDPVGTLADEAVGLREEVVEGEPGGVVDLGEDLDVERPVALSAVIGLAEESRKVAEVLGAEFDRDSGPGLDLGEVASTVAGEDQARDPGGDVQVAGHPSGGHQGGHRDRQDRDLGQESRLRCQVFEDLPQG